MAIVVMSAQTVAGTLTQHAGQTLSLVGFNYANVVALAQTEVDSLGNFRLKCPMEYKGMALLSSQDNNSLLLLLDGDTTIRLQGSHISMVDSLRLDTTSPNSLLFDYGSLQQQGNNALRAWKYLARLYEQEKVFPKRKKLIEQINSERERIAEERADFVKALDPNSYLYWYIPYRTFLSELRIVLNEESDRIPAAVALFRESNFRHPNWERSGLYQEFITQHYFMLENSRGHPDLASMELEMNRSSEHLIENLKEDQVLFNTTIAALFDLFEKRSLFKAAEFLASEVLQSSTFEIEETTAKKLEKYNSLKVGNKAPDIQLSETQRLSDFQQPILLVFGKSDCSYCKQEALELLKLYNTWTTTKKIEVVYISLDTNKQAYQQAYQNAPWPTFCDYKGWDSKPAKNYHIWGTPSYFLLDSSRTILAHLNSVAHANAWIISDRIKSKQR